MALTRAQLLAGNQDQGIVLTGEVRGVTAGSGVIISNQGVLSINASDPTFTGFIKTNSSSAYNSYQWPNNPGANKQFLQTNGAGLLDWASPSGFAVVTVQPSPAPTDPDIGELWFDCTTGSLNVYQDCYGPATWTNVAQAGRPVDPDNVDAVPAFSGGTGTQADPYICAVTTVSSGSSVYIVNAVQVTGLAPNQYVPIVDLRAALNGGRFQFTNYYADASGVLDFEIVFIDLPSSPPSTTFTAEVRVGYGSAYIESAINIVDALMVTGGTISGPAYDGEELTYNPGIASGGVPPYNYSYQWYADGVAISGATNLAYTLTSSEVGTVITAITTVIDSINESESATSNALGPIQANPGVPVIVSAGSLSPSTNVSVGATLNYTQGSFTGGIPPVADSWVWQRNGSTIAGTENAFSYVTVPADSGTSITVRYTVTDSATPAPTQVSQSTNAVVPTSPFPTPAWDPTPSGGLNTIPGLISGVYNGASPVQVTGCLEGSRNGGVSWTTGSIPIVAGETLQVRWKDTAGCGLEPTGTELVGTVTDGINTNRYTLTIDRTPSGFGFGAGSTSAALSSLQTSSPTAILGINATAYATLGSLTAGATGLQGSLDGTNWNSFPASGTGFPVTNGANLRVRFTTGSSPGATYAAVINIGDGDNVQFAASSPGFVVQNVSSSTFPLTVFTPSGAPNASPASVNFGAQSLYGTATTNASNWQDGSLNLISTGSLQFRVGAGSFGQSSTPVVNGNVVSLIWDPAAISSAADGATLNGNLATTPTLYSNAYSIQVDRSASYSLPSATGAALSTQQTTNAFTPTSFNVPVTVSFAAPTTSGALPMTAVTYSINGGTPVSVTLGTTSATLNPGQSLQIYGTTGSATTTQYGVRVTIGTSAAQEWLVTTTGVPPSIATPSISTPVSPNNTNLNPAVNSPAGIPLSGTSYTPVGGAGAQTGSTWEVYKDGFPLTSTNQITNVGQSSPAPWSEFAVPSTLQNSKVAAGPGAELVVCAQGGGSAKSTNGGQNWSTSASPSSFNPAGGAYGAGTYVFVGLDSGGAGNRVFTSTDGSAWISRSTTPFAAGGIDCVAYGAGLFVAAQSNQILSSPDGVTWTLRDAARGGSRIIYAGGQFVLLSGSAVYTSIDGITWTTSSATGVGSNAIAYGNSLYVVIAGSNTIRTSPDAITWTTRSIPPFPVTSMSLGIDLAYAAGTFVTLPYGNNGGGTNLQANAYTSPDGITWTDQGIAWQINGSSGTGPNWLVYSSDKFVTTSTRITLGGFATYTSSAPGGSTTLTISGANTDGFAAGDSIRSDPGAAASGTIVAVNSSSVTVNPRNANWANGQKIQKAGASAGTAVSGSPFSNTSAPFNTRLVPQASLTTSSNYYARVRYSTNTPSAINSNYSAWSFFSTASSFVPAPGGAFGGGYYGGQILVGSTLYNLIVAPIEGNNSGPATGGALKGQFGGTSPTGIQWKTSDTGETGGNIAEAQDLSYGKPWTDTAGGPGLSGLGGAYPLFGWCKNSSTGPNGSGGIGGFTDWYIPAKNELAVLYFFLKPDSTANDTGSGSNPNSVAPYTPNTNYGPGFPNQAGPVLFHTGGGQDFSTSGSYWSSSEVSSNTGNAWRQFFNNGFQSNGNGKSSGNNARAIRRILA